MKLDVFTVSKNPFKKGEITESDKAFLCEISDLDSSYLCLSVVRPGTDDICFRQQRFVKLLQFYIWHLEQNRLEDIAFDQGTLLDRAAA